MAKIFDMGENKEVKNDIFCPKCWVSYTRDCLKLIKSKILSRKSLFVLKIVHKLQTIVVYTQLNKINNEVIQNFLSTTSNVLNCAYQYQAWQIIQ